MRWKISRQGHDPRQIDLLAIMALVVSITAAYALIEHHAAAPRNTTAFIVPSQSARW